MPTESSVPPICQRIADIRRKLHGDRGKASFGNELGISPSTYIYYEASRVPPADVLVKIADIAQVDLRWLLTGQTPAEAIPANHPALQRVAALLADCPDAVGPLLAFVDLLAASLDWPAKGTLSAASAPAAPPSGVAIRAPVATVPNVNAVAAPNAASAAPPAGEPGAPPVAKATGAVSSSADGPLARETWIPVLGRSAAGVAQFWAKDSDAAGVRLLSELVERHAAGARQIQPAQATVPSSQEALPVQIVALSDPGADNVAEFIAAGAIKGRYPDAFAVRIDGDSMSPEIRHGDLVICSPSVEPADGAAALVQLHGQIGVTCKLFRRQGQTVHLVPVNEQFPPQSFDAARVTWAKRVLARVRVG
jgi:SOS-response transcriptional repressor LexA/transcriptional regulator with XRE-family HTH domain